MSRVKKSRPQRAIGYRFRGRVLGKRIKLLEVKRMSESTVKDTAQLQIKRKPAIQYDELGLPRIIGRGARIAHKQWLEENGYERD